MTHSDSGTQSASNTSETEASGPLHGLRVLDMTEALAGPYCGMLLGDLGADVIKIERRGNGDQSRRWGPPFLAGESAYYLSVNRNKRSLEIDLDAPEDRELLHRLVGTADVFMTNIPRLSSLKKRSVDPESLQKLNPQLIYAAISGYGHRGPKAQRPGYDIIAQGEAGLMALTGEPDGGPMRFPTPMADISGGIYCLLGIQAALYARDRPGGTGRGQFLDIALVDAQTTWLANVGGSFFATGNEPRRLGNQHPSITPYQPVRARDRTFLIAVGTERLWEKLCGVLGWTETLRVDPRFADNAARNGSRDLLIEKLEAELAQKDAAEWIEALLAVGVPAGPIHLPSETLTDDHLKARGMVVELEHPEAGPIRSIGLPVLMSETGPTYRRYPPRLGEHNDEIREELDSRDS